MDNFTKGNRGDRNSKPHTMHSAICSSCGKACEVPFQPTGDKPVYCRDCFAGRAAMGGDRSGRPDNRQGQRLDQRKDYRNSRPANSQSNNSQGGGGNNNELKGQLEAVNAKLERLITAVQALASAPASAPVPEKKVAKKAAKKSK